MKCLLCNKIEATKSGSHIIPNFLMKRINSFEGCNKRGYEFGFIIGDDSVKSYFGRHILPEKRRLFTDDDSKVLDCSNYDIKDFVFCPNCEKYFADLESKYSQSLNIPFDTQMAKNMKSEPQIAFLFWISVIWRISVTNHLGTKLPSEFEEVLRKALIQKSTVDYNLHYALFRSKDFSKNNATYAAFDYHDGVAFLILDEFCVALFMEQFTAPKTFTFWEIFNYEIKDKSKLNDGLKHEIIANMPECILKQIQHKMLLKLCGIFNLRGKVEALHQFIFGAKIRQDILDETIDEMEKAKLADKYTMESLGKSFYKVLKNHPDKYPNFN